MRVSRLLAPIVKKPAENVTDLLVNNGYIAKSSAGVFSMLPLGMRVQRKIEAVIRRRMDEIEGAETALPTLAMRAIWDKSGRSDNKELFRTGEDRYMLAATCEEEVTGLVGDTIRSGRDLPLRLYQIGKKFRNERRPRGGLLRGKEFVMKDMYSFDKTRGDAHHTYRQVQTAYTKLFQDIGVPVVVAEADSGNIGGSLSHEYHYLSTAGEDSVVSCGHCGYTANMEKAVSNGQEVVETGHAQVRYFMSKSLDEFIGVYYPPDRKLNPILVDDLVEIDHTCEDVVGQYEQSDALTRRMVRIIDPRVGVGCELPEPPIQVNKTQTTTLYEPIVEVVAGEECMECNKPGLETAQAIEVAHTFYLGTKYSEQFACKLDNVPIEMGCYGIGVSRMISAIAQVTRDQEGLKWPRSVSPFDAVVVSTDESVGLGLVQQLGRNGIEAVWDDRSGQFGALLGASRSFGFPMVVVAGKKYATDGVVEVQLRDKSAKEPVFVNINELHTLKDLL